MGYVNGVFVPDIDSVGWGDELNDFLTAAGRAYIDVTLAPYGADPTGVADSSTAIQAAVDAGPGTVYFPPGTYKLADGTGITLTNNRRLIGTSGATTISVKNAYAFSGTSIHDVGIAGFFIDVRAGATTGGGVRSIGGSNNTWYLRHIYVNNVATNTEPGIWLRGWIGNYMWGCQSVNGQIGVHLDATGFANSNSFTRCRVAGNSVAGFRINGEGNQVRECIIESNTGYGIELDYAFLTVISGCHFEDCKQHAIYSHGDTGNTLILGNAFWSYMSGAAAGTRFVYLDATAGHDSTNTNVIANQFYNQTTMLEVASGVANAAILYNAGLQLANSSVVDAGTNTTFLAPEGGQKFPQQYTSGALWMVGPASPTLDKILYATGANSHNSFWVDGYGYPVFRTIDGDPGAGGILSNSTFVFYQDAADSDKIKVRVRKADGNYLTGTVVTPT
jgi:hypothetical protein